MEAICRKLPEAEYNYIADSKNCPYGEKDDAELMQIVRANVEKLRAWGADVIVIACNTATTRCIEKLRNKYPDTPFVGTEPAISLAARTNAKRILIMATPGTIKSERMAVLLKENHKTGQDMELLSCAGLADAIEADFGIDEKLHELFDGMRKDYEVVVLGCTHYSLIKNRIAQYFPDAKLIDGNEGVAKKVVEITKIPS